MAAKGLCRGGALPGGRLCRCCHMLCLMPRLATGLIRLLGAREMGKPASEPAVMQVTATLPDTGTDALPVLMEPMLTAAWAVSFGAALSD